MDGNLRSLFRKHLRSGWDWQAIENWGIGSGVPDGNCCCSGVEFWVEFKLARGWRLPTLTPTQVAWAERRTRSGGRVFVAARKSQSLYLFSASVARELLKTDLREVPALGVWHGGPARWDWAAVGRILLRKPAGELSQPGVEETMAAG